MIAHQTLKMLFNKVGSLNDFSKAEKNTVINHDERKDETTCN